MLVPTRNVLPEIDRILCLSCDFRQPEDTEALQPIIEEYTERFQQPNGEWTLKPAQALALDTLREHKALIASISVGGGKTLVSQLAPLVAGVEPIKTLVLTRASLIDPWIRSRAENKRHFKIARHYQIQSYARLSHPDYGPYLLEDIQPDLIIADECHALANPDSSRRNRFEIYFEDHPDTQLVAMSGTITKKSIEDWAWLAELALGKDRTPLPTTYSLLEVFKACVDASDDHKYAKTAQWKRFQPVETVFGDGRTLVDIHPLTDRREAARGAFYNRISTAPGIVHTSRDTVGAGLEISLIDDLKPPTAIMDALQKAEKEYILPNDDEIETPIDKARACKQISQGCFYFWDWPGEPDWDWVETRRAKSREIRRAIKEGPREIDSPTLVKRAIEEGTFDHDVALLEAMSDWQPHKHKDPPPTKPEWVSDYLIDDVMRRAKKRGKRPPALVWCAHRHVAERLAEKGMIWYDPDRGENPELADPKDGPIVLSIDSHAEGLNLQHKWYRNIILSPPSGGHVWEQMLGRTHRSGQPQDTVFVEIYAHLPVLRDALTRARHRAKYIAETNGQEQKLLIADWLTLP